jgi:hypothetical protein
MKSGVEDIFVSKMNANLDILIASTYIGGNLRERANSITLDSSGNVYVTGYTYSSDYPTSTRAYDRSFSSPQAGQPRRCDIIVSKLSSDLGSLLASTFVGLSGANDCGNSIATDNQGNVYIAGYTSSHYPVTFRAYDRTYNGANDAVISKFDANLTILEASTYLGGNQNDAATSIAVDSGGSIYVAGYTASANFPTSSGAYDRNYNGYTSNGHDVFISKLSNTLNTLSASTFVGCAGKEVANSGNRQRQ